MPHWKANIENYLCFNILWHKWNSSDDNNKATSLLTLISNSLENFLPQPNISGIFKEVKNLFSQTNQFFCWLPLRLLHWIFSALYNPGGLSLAHQVLLFQEHQISALLNHRYTILRKVILSPLGVIFCEGHSRNAAYVPKCFRDCNAIIPFASFWFCSCFQLENLGFTFNLEMSCARERPGTQPRMYTVPLQRSIPLPQSSSLCGSSGTFMERDVTVPRGWGEAHMILNQR